MQRALALWGQRGWHGQEVAGESHYGANLKRIFGPAGTQGRELIKVASLIPEPANPYDPNAVQVVIDGLVVGYLPKEDAVRYRPVLSSLVANGWLPQTSATIWGRMSEDYDYDTAGREVRTTQFVGSVRLALAEPHLLVPANAAPTVAHVLLPAGGAIQVTGEEKYMASLVPLLRPEGETWVHVTLHELDESTARAEKTVVEVRVNDQVAGKLTPKMSSELLPAISHFDNLGVTTAARAILKGNQLKADLTLYVARTGELSADWLAQPPITSQSAPVGTTPTPPAPSDVYGPSGPANAHWIFNSPPGWPPPPSYWTPPEGWAPPLHLPPAPPGWQWWSPAQR